LSTTDSFILYGDWNIRGLSSHQENLSGRAMQREKETGPKAADFSGVRLRWISVASRPVDSST
jgi:hypothetical protein